MAKKEGEITKKQRMRFRLKANKNDYLQAVYQMMLRQNDAGDSFLI